MRPRILAILASVAIAAFTVVGLASPTVAATTTVDADGKTLEFNNTVKVGENAEVGFSTRYVNVVSDGVTTVDAIVTVSSVNNLTLSNVDRVSTSNNWQLWTNLRINSGGGFSTYRIEFVKTGTRDPVLLQDFSVNVGDIDARQFVEFTGPTSYTLAQNTQLAVQTASTNPSAGIPIGAFRFAEPNGTGSDDSDTRFWAQVNYASVSSVNVKLGSTIGGSALYQVSFGAASWGATAAAPITPNPPIYTVSYEPNPGLVSGGGGSTNSTSLTGGTAHTIPINGFTLPGYVFVSWNSRSDGSGVSYAPGSAITPSTNVALYAIWKSTSTTVTFFGNGATSGTVPAQATVAAGAQYTVAANTGGLSLAGNQFVGWNTTADGTGAFYLPGTLLNIPANTNLYAVWEPIPVVPPDAPINIDLEPGEPIAGAEVDYVIPNQPYDPSCDPTTDPSSAWSLTVKPIDPAGAAYEIDAGCTPPDGDVFGTAVLPQDVPGGIYEVVYQSASGEKIIRYFVVSPDGNFSGQTNVDPRIAKTGTESTVFLSPILVTSLSLALLALGTMLLTMRQLRTRLTH
jgi:hypothetical protein